MLSELLDGIVTHAYVSAGLRAGYVGYRQSEWPWHAPQERISDSFFPFAQWEFWERKYAARGFRPISFGDFVFAWQSPTVREIVLRKAVGVRRRPTEDAVLYAPVVRAGYPGRFDSKFDKARFRALRAYSPLASDFADSTGYTGRETVSGHVQSS